jgi:hypothetical protein
MVKPIPEPFFLVVKKGTNTFSIKSFALAQVFSMLFAVLKVNMQSFKVASANPIDALKYELDFITFPASFILSLPGKRLKLVGNMRKKTQILLGFFLLILITEVFLRFYLGFCNTILYRADNSYEYIAAPGQHRFRMRNNISYNLESMRSPELKDSSIKVLGFGDSILNGGVMTDQDSLASTLLSDSLTKIYHKEIQFLNISSGSWGPDNCYAFLKKHGSYRARHLFLFVNSHDAYDNMDFVKTVGINESLPNKQYIVAIYELWNRYILTSLKTARSGSLEINKKKNGDVFNTGFQAFANYSKSTGIPLTFYLHSGLLEVINKNYNTQGKEIIRFAKDHEINLITDLDKLKKADFRDRIHLNNQGQKRMAMLVLKYINAHKF